MAVVSDATRCKVRSGGRGVVEGCPPVGTRLNLTNVELKLNVGSGQAMSQPGLNLHLTCEYVTYRFRYSYYESAVDLSQGSGKHQTHCRYL